MLLTNVWGRMLGRAALPRRPRASQPPIGWGRTVVPRLEPLEERTVLSTWMVTSTADSGDGSLRTVIAAAQDGDQIVFDPSLHGQTITLTSGELAVSTVSVLGKVRSSSTSRRGMKDRRAGRGRRLQRLPAETCVSQHSKVRCNMVWISCSESWSAIPKKAIGPGAQTERRASPGQ